MSHGLHKCCVAAQACGDWCCCQLFHTTIDWDSTKVLDREIHYYKHKLKEVLVLQQRPSLNRDAGLDLPSIYDHLFSHNWPSQLCAIADNSTSHHKPELLHNTYEDLETWSKISSKTTKWLWRKSITILWGKLSNLVICLKKNFSSGFSFQDRQYKKIQYNKKL